MNSRDGEYIDLLIPNFNGHEAVQLCILSILKRTAYKSYKIIVLDNLGNGQDRDWLRKQRDAENIELIENDGAIKKPGQAMTALLRHTTAELACHMESDVEILRADWLNLMVSQIRDWQRDIVVCRYFPAKSNANWWVSPVVGPECILFNMPLYRQIMEDDDMQQSSVKFEDYKYRFVFDEIEPPPKPNGYVNLDTCWKLTEKLRFENRWGFNIQFLPINFFYNYVWHYGGISTRGLRPEIQPRWRKIRERLAMLERER